MERLQGIQDEVGAWASANFGLHRPAYRSLLGAGEELGQLFRAHLKMEQGIKSMDTDKFYVEAKDALGDTIIYLLDYCATMGISLESALKDTWEEVKKRDWKKYPETGSEIKLTDEMPDPPKPSPIYPDSPEREDI